MDSTSPSHAGYQSFAPYRLRDIRRHGPDKPFFPSEESLRALRTHPGLFEKTVKIMEDFIRTREFNCECE